MKTILSGFYLALSGLVLSGCAATSKPGVVISKPMASNISAPTSSSSSSTLGLESILGLTAPQLERLFGKAQLDAREANGRKLQFRGKACIMDIYLYVPNGQQNAVAKHIDARRSDGAAVDRASCVKALAR